MSSDVRFKEEVIRHLLMKSFSLLLFKLSTFIDHCWFKKFNMNNRQTVMVKRWNGHFQPRFGYNLWTGGNFRLHSTLEVFNTSLFIRLKQRCRPARHTLYRFSLPCQWYFPSLFSLSIAKKNIAIHSLSCLIEIENSLKFHRNWGIWTLIR